MEVMITISKSEYDRLVLESKAYRNIAKEFNVVMNTLMDTEIRSIDELIEYDNID